ncbi:MAG: hypothetical protein ACFE8V_02700 [Promethearchaeota archaeon]
MELNTLMGGISVIFVRGIPYFLERFLKGIEISIHGIAKKKWT